MSGTGQDKGSGRGKENGKRRENGIAIVGQGIAGSATALALLREGHDDLTLIAPDAQPSAGPSPLLTLGPNATRVLYALGLRDALHALALHPEQLLDRDLDSAQIWHDLPLGTHLQARFGAPLVLVYYHQLHQLLWSTVNALAARARISSRALTINQTGTLTLDNGDERAFALIVCASGAGPPGPTTVEQPSTSALYFTTTETPALPPALEQNALCRWFHPEALLFTVRTAEQSALYLARTGSGTEHWHDRLREVVASLPWHVHREPPLALREHWGDGTCVYIGAARGGAPLEQGQGAALALEDAWVLARLIEQRREQPAAIGAALTRYRRPRIQQVAAHFAREARRRHSGGAWQRRAKAGMSLLGDRFLPELGYQRHSWLYGYDCVRGFH